MRRLCAEQRQEEARIPDDDERVPAGPLPPEPVPPRLEEHVETYD